MLSPKVSVVIPAYNAMKFLPSTVKSALAQSYDNFEILIINDGSTDNIEEWFSTLKDDRLRLISQENKGLAGARNTGIKSSTGEYIAFLDADDLWHPAKLQKQVDTFSSYPDTGLVYTWVVYINESDNRTGKTFKHTIEGYIWDTLALHNIVECGSVAMVKRQCFEEVGYFDQDLGSFVEDWDMWLRIASFYPFRVVTEPLVYYRQVSSSASRNWLAMQQSFEKVITKNFKLQGKESTPLMNQSYALSNICLAWKTIQCNHPNFKEAKAFRDKALRLDSNLFWSKDYWKLLIASTFMQILGLDFYRDILVLFHKIRSRLTDLNSTITRY